DAGEVVEAGGEDLAQRGGVCTRDADDRGGFGGVPVYGAVGRGGPTGIVEELSLVPLGQGGGPVGCDVGENLGLEGRDVEFGAEGEDAGECVCCVDVVLREWG